LFSDSSNNILAIFCLKTLQFLSSIDSCATSFDFLNQSQLIGYDSKQRVLHLMNWHEKRIYEKIFYAENGKKCSYEEEVKKESVVLRCSDSVKNCRIVSICSEAVILRDTDQKAVKISQLNFY
jgi:hypothetical protein